MHAQFENFCSLQTKFVRLGVEVKSTLRVIAGDSTVRSFTGSFASSALKWRSALKGDGNCLIAGSSEAFGGDPETHIKVFEDTLNDVSEMFDSYG